MRSILQLMLRLRLLVADLVVLNLVDGYFIFVSSVLDFSIMDSRSFCNHLSDSDSLFGIFLGNLSQSTMVLLSTRMQGFSTMTV